jgi:hypothetical protein
MYIHLFVNVWTVGNSSLTGNYITNVSRIARTYNPAAAVSGDGNYVAFNYFAHVPHTAYTQGGCDNLFEHNVIEMVCFETADAGGMIRPCRWCPHAPRSKMCIIYFTDSTMV